MKHDISPELAAAFTKRAAALGFEIRTAFANSDKKLCLIAYQGQTEVCHLNCMGVCVTSRTIPWLWSESSSTHFCWI